MINGQRSRAESITIPNISEGMIQNPLLETGSTNDEATRTQQSINTRTLSRLHHQTDNQLKQADKRHQGTNPGSCPFNSFFDSNPATMKTLTLLVAVATVLTIICLQENTAVAEVRTQLLFISFLAAALSSNAEKLTEC